MIFKGTGQTVSVLRIAVGMSDGANFVVYNIFVILQAGCNSFEGFF